MDLNRGPRLTRWIAPGLIIVLAFTARSERLEGQGSNSQAAGVTFAKDIAPILQRACQSCHQPGSIAPMSLITYDEVRPWAKSIKYRTGRHDKPDVMPPWFIDKTIGIQRYKDDMSLSADEIAKIAAWADNGAPLGNPAEMPPPAKLADANGWRLGAPDLIVSSPTVEVAALQPDWWGALPSVQSGNTEDRYVASVEIKEVTDVSQAPAASGPGNRKTVGGQSIIHHLQFGVMNEKGAPVGGSWPVHEVGRNPDVFDSAAGKLLPKNAKLNFGSVHLHANGKHTKSHVEFGFKFHPRGYKPTKEFDVMFISASRALDVNPMEANQKLEAFLVLKENTQLMVFEPHLHAAGVRMCLDAIWGNTAETLTCAGYNHGWIRLYTYADDAQPLLPKGTILRATSYFDTTPANKNVSDPRNWSGLGNRSIDNMAAATITNIKLSDEQFEKEMEKRRERLAAIGKRSTIGCPLCGQSKATATVARGQ
jgi:hypothetical protein